MTYGIQVVTREVNLHLSHIADHFYEYCPLSEQDIGNSVLVVMLSFLGLTATILSVC